MIIGVDLFILAAWNKLEDVDGLPLTTPSTMRLPFIRDRSVGNQTAYSEDDHVNSVAPGTSSGWEEPKRTKRNYCNAMIWNSLKSSENHVKYWGQSNTVHGLVLDRSCSRWQISSKLTNSQFNMFKHVLVKTTKLTMLVGPGLLWVRSYSDVAWCCYIPNTFTKHSDARQWKPSKFEQLSDIHKERVLKNAVGVSKHDDHHWCHWGGSMIYSS